MLKQSTIFLLMLFQGIALRYKFPLFDLIFIIVILYYSPVIIIVRSETAPIFDVTLIGIPYATNETFT